MRKINLYIIASLCFLCIKTGYSQQYLSLEDCRKLAIQNNRELQIAEEQVRIAHYNKKEALANFFPEISFVGTYLHNQKDLHLISSSSIPSSVTMPDIPWLPIEIPPAGTEIDISDIRNKILDAGKVEIKNIWAGGFNLVQPLFMGGKIVAYNDLRKYAEELAYSMNDTKITNVIVEIDNTYWQVVSLVNKKAGRSLCKVATEMEADVSAMEREGVATKADRLSVSVKLNEAEMSLLKVNNGVSLSKMLLCQLCGMEINDQIVLQDENIENLTVDAQADILPDVNTALANRNELRSLQLATRVYEKQEQIARADMLPNFAFTANYLWTNPNMFDGFEKKFDGMWNVGLVLKVPLNFWSTAPKLNAAKVETRTKRLELTEAREKIILDVNQSAYKLNEAYKKMQTARKNVENADENLRYANVGFDEGVIPASDALAAHTAWVSAHSDMIDAQIDVVLGKVYLNKALGNNITNQ